MRKFTLCFFMLLVLHAAPARAAIVQVALLGVAAEHGGVGGQGPIGAYENMVSSMLAISSGTDILVLGGGKSPLDDVTTFWQRVASDLSVGVTFEHGADGIQNRPFPGFAMIVVVSSQAGGSSGGLTQDENDALAAREDDIAAFVKTGGAVLGFSQCGLVNPYAYLVKAVGDLPQHVNLDYADITPTPEGTDLGVSDALDGGSWKEEYAPSSFFEVLATNAATGNPAAVRLLLSVDPICDFYFPGAIVGTEGDDVLFGTPGPDVIFGLGGNDTIKGLGGDDILCGGDGDDQLYGGGGSDFLSGGTGNDSLYGGPGNDLLDGGGDDDVLRGESGDDYLDSGTGRDRLKGGNGDDTLNGSDGDDQLFGEEGNDTLNGGTGIDRLSDHVGANSCANGEWGAGCE
jgi:Ca2+-binding RTX toxin-like protein